jgi:hypothetical protein
MSFIGELWKYFKIRKKYWLIPLFVAMAVFGALLVLSKGSVVAPFIYTLF